MQSKATSPDEYIESLPADRKKIISDIRKAIKKNIPKGFSEEMNYGMLGYVVPHSIYPNGYHCNPKQPVPFLCVASQKNYISIYHVALYEGALLDWFKKQWSKASEKKLDMGKCCIRFKKADDVPLKLIGELAGKMTVAEWLKIYEASIVNSRKKK